MASNENKGAGSGRDAEKKAESDERTNEFERGEARKSNDTTASETVPRSQYEHLLERLGVLEKKITTIDNTVHSKDMDSDDDQHPEDAKGPWLDYKSLNDIRFLIRTARSVRKSNKAVEASMKIYETAREEGKKSHLKTDGEKGLSAAQLLHEGTKVVPEFSVWPKFREQTDRSLGHALPLLEPIFILVGEPNINERLFLNGQAPPEEVGDRPLDESQRARLPERIQICSFPLLRALEIAFGSTIPWNGSGVVFLRPFKSLVYFEHKLRQRQSDLRETINRSVQAGVSILPWKEDPSKKGHEHNKGTENGSLELPSSQISPDQEGHTSVRHQKLLQESATLLQLNCLLDVFDGIIKPRLHEFQDNNYHEEIAFDELWSLFRPGDLVLDQGEKQAYRLIQVITPEHKGTSPWARWFRDNDDPSDSDSEFENESGGDPLRLECVFLDYDGVQFGPVSKSFRIPRYEGIKPIKSLPIYHLRFSVNPTIRQQLIQRGKVLIDVATYRSMYYTGFSLDANEEIDSQVVVDFAEALSVTENESWKPRIAPASTGNRRKTGLMCTESCCIGRVIYNDDLVDRKLVESFMQNLMPEQTDKPPLTVHPRLWSEMEKEGYTLSDDELLITTYRVFAFVLRSRKWAKLDLTHLKYDNKETRRSIESAFKRLVLPDGHKEMVQALVTQHFHGRTLGPGGAAQPDLIRGKGKGLIVLLHGAPGVGKTTTAEGIAEEFKRPLFQITCGDLGTTPLEVQTELEKNFSLASRWGCVLLLDEADVFLAQRERKDLTRNALVAIFLRILEYYTGILFLTTNRVGDFDEAFASRIHMSLHYPELDAVKTKKVFELNLDLIKERMLQQDRHFTIDEEAILDFAEMHYENHEYGRWNGRQIRNACQTALALAEYESEKNTVFLKPRHFKKVQEAYLDFSWYLGETFGTRGDRRAYENQLRAEEPNPLTVSESSIARAERNTQSSRTRPSVFRPTAQQQAAPMQPSQPMHGTYSSMQMPQEGQYFPSSHLPRAPTSQMGPNAPRQYGHQGQTWAGQTPMHQQPGQYPYQQPQPSQPSYQQGFVMQSHDQTGDSGNDDGTNPGTRPVDF